MTSSEIMSWIPPLADSLVVAALLYGLIARRIPRRWRATTIALGAAVISLLAESILMTLPRYEITEVALPLAHISTMIGLTATALVLRHEVLRPQRMLERVEGRHLTSGPGIGTVPDMVVSLTRDGIVRRVDKYGAALLSGEEGGLIGRDFFSTCVLPQDLSRVREDFFVFVANTGRSDPTTECWVHSVGGDRLIGWRRSAQVDESGEVIGVVCFGKDITESRRVETELAAAQARLEYLAANSAVVAYTCEAFGDFNATYISPNIELVAGYTVGQFLSERGFWADRIHPDDRGRIMGELEELFVRDHHTHSYRWRIADGSYLHFQDEMKLIRDEYGTPVEIVGALIDVTDRVAAREAARASEERLASAFTLTPDAIAITRLDGSFVEVNEGFTRILGYTPEDIAENTSLELGIWASVEERAAAHAELLEHGIVIDREVCLRRKDGSARTCLISARLMEVDGSPCVLAVTKDITHRKGVEILLGRYEALSHHARDIMLFVRQSDGRILEANTAAEGAYGYGRDQLLSLNIKDLRAPEEIEFLEEQMSAAAQGSVRFETIHRRADGSRFPVEVSSTGAAVLGEDAVLFKVIRDVTDRKRAEEDLRKANAGLERMIFDVVEVMGKIVELRDPYTKGHEVRVADLSTMIAREMGLPDDDIEGIEIAAHLHDVGKLCVPVELLTKPGRLSDVEFALVRGHSQAGHDITKSIDFPWPISDIIAQHHERMNGSGYPRGLKGDEILLEARILAVADVVEAMASHRPYRPSLGLDAAVGEIRDRPHEYDPGVTEALLRLHESGLVERLLLEPGQADSGSRMPQVVAVGADDTRRVGRPSS